MYFSEEQIKKAQQDHKDFFDKAIRPDTHLRVNWSLYNDLVEERPMVSAADEIIRYLKPVYDSKPKNETDEKVSRKPKTSTKKGKGKSE